MCCSLQALQRMLENAARSAVSKTGDTEQPAWDCFGLVVSEPDFVRWVLLTDSAV